MQDCRWGLTTAEQRGRIASPSFSLAILIREIQKLKNMKGKLLCLFLFIHRFRNAEHHVTAAKA